MRPHRRQQPGTLVEFEPELSSASPARTPAPSPFAAKRAGATGCSCIYPDAISRVPFKTFTSTGPGSRSLVATKLIWEAETNSSGATFFEPVVSISSTVTPDKVDGRIISVASGWNCRQIRAERSDDGARRCVRPEIARSGQAPAEPAPSTNSRRQKPGLLVPHL